MMTEEEYHSLKETYKFLSDLIDSKKVPNIPKELRDKAKKCLKHYPNSRDYPKVSDTFKFFNPR